ncbi:MAG: hypothetical protein WAM84_07790 [Candidatus Cybelea sp.]
MHEVAPIDVVAGVDEVANVFRGGLVEQLERRGYLLDAPGAHDHDPIR